jgi:hypothetical protein
VISSEVQRTLVKSPPELWAEISDPESLARHLGEFGEIRITRVQPEQKVEWEADDASGTVVIKPSGWGTKVKLTVMRELGDVDAEAQDTEPEPERTLEHAPEPTQDAEPEPQHSVEPELEEIVEPELEENVEPEQSAEREHAPALAPELAAERSVAGELDGDELDDDELDDAPLAEAASELEAESPAEPEHQPEAEPEPRRGFFARLFGRRRARAQEASAVSLAGSEQGPIEREQLQDRSETSEDDFELARATEPGSTREQEPVLSARLLDEPLEALEDMPDELEDPPGKALADVAGADEQPLATSAASPVAADEPQPDAAAARTKLAEEIAAEEVTAVLTGVLDRLGAAHHRPFSRA